MFYFPDCLLLCLVSAQFAITSIITEGYLSPVCLGIRIFSIFRLLFFTGQYNSIGKSEGDSSKPAENGEFNKKAPQLRSFFVIIVSNYFFQA